MKFLNLKYLKLLRQTRAQVQIFEKDPYIILLRNYSGEFGFLKNNLEASFNEEIFHKRAPL